MRRYTILGERRSGTNFLERLISDNFDLKLDWLGGWKHFFGYNGYDNKLKNNQDVIYFCIVRNPIDFLMSFYNTKLMQSEERIKNIESFLLTEFYSVYYHKGKEIDIIDDYNFKNNNVRYKNIFEMRSVKCKYLLDDMPNLVNNYYFIRYEDLKHNTNCVMDEIYNKFNLVKKYDQYVLEKNFVGVRIGNNDITENYQVNENVRQIIYDNIDLVTEHRMKYLLNI
jgi:hypothetical protein